MISYKDCRITWEKVNGNHFVMKTPVPCGMTGLVAKLQSASCGNKLEGSIPVSQIAFPTGGKGRF